VDFISLEETADKEYARLRKEFLMQAKRHYQKQAWNEQGNKHLAYIGAGFGIGGAALGHYFESVWFLVPMGAGVMNMLQAWWKKHCSARDSVKALDNTTKDLTKEQLEQRIKDKDYDLPPITPETAKDMEMGIYAIEVAGAVAEKDYNIKRYPANLLGGAMLVYAGYQSLFQSPYAGVGTATAAGIVMFGAHMIKKRRIIRAAEKTHEFLKQKGYDYFDMYIRKKPHYDFYQQFIKKRVCA
jgi:hypothetical protein